MTPRRTLAREARITGRGLHTGAPVRLVFHPAPCDTGIRFRRADLPGVPEVAAHVRHAFDTARRTALRLGDVEVSTVEHVLAAIQGLGLDDIVVALDGPEPPAADGSARAFVHALETSGTVTQDGAVSELRLDEPLTIRTGGAAYDVTPAEDLVLDVRIHWPHPAIGRQDGRWAMTRDTFVTELAGARTFGFVAERADLAAQGLARGASADNAILLGPTGVLNGPLRWPDEFVRHKALDLLGDLALLGARLNAVVVAAQPGHRANRALVRALLERCGAGTTPRAAVPRPA